MLIIKNAALLASASETLVIQGVITELQVALRKKNLLAQIASRYQTGSTVAELGQIEA